MAVNDIKGIADCNGGTSINTVNGINDVNGAFGAARTNPLPDTPRPAISQVKVRVPATSANLGSGFDSVGLALDYYDELTFTRNPAANGSAQNHPMSAGGSEPDGVRVIIHGEGEDTLPRDETHLVVSMFRRACRTFGLPRFGFTLESCNRIPQARGMGSSAEAIVAGISAAAAFAGLGDDVRDVSLGAFGQGTSSECPSERSSEGAAVGKDPIFALAAEAEGHPDNVAPAVYGGLTVSWKQQAGEGTGSLKIADAEPLQTGFHTVRYPVSPDVHASVFVPDFELSTQRARQALPARVPYASAVHNVSRVALLPAAMNCTDAAHGNQLLFAATQDLLHQPYRKALMPSSWELIERLRSQGFAAAVSGAGPCVLVLHYGQARSQIDAAAAGQLNSGHWRVLHLPVNVGGVSVRVS